MIRMRLRFRFWWRRRRAAIACPAAAPVETVAAADLPLGPGWFDSSWDLRCGLEVSEGLPANASVDEWLMVPQGPAIPPGAVGLPAPLQARERPLGLVQGQGWTEPQWVLSPA